MDRKTWDHLIAAQRKVIQNTIDACTGLDLYTGFPRLTTHSRPETLAAEIAVLREQLKRLEKKHKALQKHVRAAEWLEHLEDIGIREGWME